MGRRNRAAECAVVNQRQQHIIEFQNAQIEALLKQLGRKRLLLKDVFTQILPWSVSGITAAAHAGNTALLANGYFHGSIPIFHVNHQQRGGGDGAAGHAAGGDAEADVG